MSILEGEGLEALSIRRVAREIGVSHPAVLHHFGCASELRAAMAHRGFVDLDRAMEEATVRVIEPEARFQALGVAYATYGFAHPTLFRLMFRCSSFRQHWSEASEAAAERSFERVRRACLSGMPDCDAERLATLAWSAMHGAMMLWLDGPFQLRFGSPSVVSQVAKSVTELLPWSEGV